MAVLVIVLEVVKRGDVTGPVAMIYIGVMASLQWRHNYRKMCLRQNVKQINLKPSSGALPTSTAVPRKGEKCIRRKQKWNTPVHRREPLPFIIKRNL